METHLRRLAGTAAFVLLISFLFFALPAVEGRGDSDSYWWLMLLMVPVGYLVAMAAEVAVDTGRWNATRDGMRSTALRVVAVVGGVAGGVVISTLVSGDISAWDLVHAALWAGAFLLYIFLLPRIVSPPTGR